MQVYLSILLFLLLLALPASPAPAKQSDLVCGKHSDETWHRIVDLVLPSSLKTRLSADNSLDNRENLLSNSYNGLEPKQKLAILRAIQNIIESEEVIKKTVEEPKTEPEDSTKSTEETTPSSPISDGMAATPGVAEEMVATPEVDKEMISIPEVAEGTEETEENITEATLETKSSYPEVVDEVIPEITEVSTESSGESSSSSAEVPEESSSSSAEVPEESSSSSAEVPEESSSSSAEVPEESSSSSAEVPEESSSSSAEVPEDEIEGTIKKLCESERETTEMPSSRIYESRPILSPPIWVDITAAYRIADPLSEIKINRYDRYDRYASSIAHDVFRIRMF